MWCYLGFRCATLRSLLSLWAEGATHGVTLDQPLQAGGMDVDRFTGKSEKDRCTEDVSPGWLPWLLKKPLLQPWLAESRG